MDALKPCPFCGGSAHQADSGITSCTNRNCLVFCQARTGERWNTRAESALTQSVTWVPVGERLPDAKFSEYNEEKGRFPRLLVLCPRYSDEPLFCWYFRSRFRIEGSPSDWTKHVTHWAEPLKYPTQLQP